MPTIPQGLAALLPGLLSESWLAWRQPAPLQELATRAPKTQGLIGLDFHLLSHQGHGHLWLLPRSGPARPHCPTFVSAQRPTVETAWPAGRLEALGPELPTCSQQREGFLPPLLPVPTPGLGLPGLPSRHPSWAPRVPRGTSTEGGGEGEGGLGSGLQEAASLRRSTPRFITLSSLG